MTALYTVKYHPEVRSDIASLTATMKERIRRAIETRLMTAPHEYGEPLRKTLKGYWKLRIGDYRVVFKVEETTVFVLGIRHRKEVYKEMQDRIPPF